MQKGRLGTDSILLLLKISMNYKPKKPGWPNLLPREILSGKLAGLNGLDAFYNK